MYAYLNISTSDGFQLKIGDFIASNLYMLSVY